jgi:hypothetical protein
MFSCMYHHLSVEYSHSQRVNTQLRRRCFKLDRSGNRCHFSLCDGFLHLTLHNEQFSKSFGSGCLFAELGALSDCSPRDLGDPEVRHSSEGLSPERDC